MAVEVRAYLGEFKWAPPIRNLYLASGVGGVVAVFLVEFTTKIKERDQYLWVIVGDLPSAYLVTDDMPGPKEAMEVYCELMQEWIDAVKEDSGLEDVFPVAAPPTSENADSLQSRLTFLKREIIPEIFSEE